MNNNNSSTSSVFTGDDDGNRWMHLAGLLPVTRPERGAFAPLESRVFYILGGFLAVQHFNARDNVIIDDGLSNIIAEHCPDLYLSIEYRDTQYSKTAGAAHIQEILQQPQLPAALIGAGRSDVSETVHTLSSIYGIPQVSPHSSAASLDDKARYPYFARTTPSSKADGKAAVEYFESLGVSHFGVIYVLDVLGSSYNEDIRREAAARDMVVESVPYNHLDTDENIRSALRRLKESGMRYLFAVIEPSTWKEFIRIAIAENMIGNDRTFWLFHSGMVGLVPEELEQSTEYDLARAIHGSGVLLKNFPPNPVLDQLLVEYEWNSVKQQDFVNHWSDPSIFEGFDFRYPGANYPQYINYDAVMSVGLAACQANNTLITGAELYQSLLQTEFDGASSYVTFDVLTGTRNSVPFEVDNILMIDKGNNTLGFEQAPAALLDGVGNVDSISNFIYWDNTTTAPATLPPMDNHDLNLIPTGLLALGLALGVLTLLTSLFWAIWVFQWRSSAVVRLSQPFFLLQLCLGCFVMAASVIPMSLQEPISTHGLNNACMAVPWLLFTGYAIAFSASVAKMWRINTIFASAERFQSITISVKGASWPLAILLTTNIILLTVWTIIAPLVWIRTPVEDSVDRFGRPRESYGSCKVEQGSETASNTIAGLLVIVNSAGLLVSNYQGFKTRKLQSEFNERFYLAVSNACILEVLCLGIPVLILANDSPTANFMVKALMTSVLCLCILLPLFVPKYLQRKIQRRRTQLNEVSTAPTISRFSESSTSGAIQQAPTFLASQGTTRISGFNYVIPEEDESRGQNNDEMDQEDEHATKLLIIRHEEYFVQRNLRTSLASEEEES